MPIKFACEHCGQKLRVASRKGGTRAKCPKCRQPIVVPGEPEGPTAASTPTDDAADDEDPYDEDPYAEFVVYDDEVEWVYEDDEAGGDVVTATATDINRVSVPRNVLYMQGILLAVVALISFVLGVMVGSGGTPTQLADKPPEPCILSGAVVYKTGGGRSRPDDGSVVLVVPTDDRPAPTNKAVIEGLRPGDPVPQEGSDNLQIIRAIGGAYARADSTGQYQLRLPDSGRYFVLVVSRNAYRLAGDDVDKVDIAQLGRYVQPPTDLLGNSKYEWRELVLSEDRTLDFTF